MEYRIWNYIKSAHNTTGNTTSPDHLNYNDPAIMRTHLHQRIWTVMGLVVQAVHYAEFNPTTRAFSVPVVLEEWFWTLDKATSFAIARTMSVRYFEDVAGVSLIPNPTVSTKYYTTHAMQLDEIERRHRNLINDIKGLALKTLMLTETGGDLKQAISIGSTFVAFMHPHIQAYISDGLPTFAEVSSTAAVRARFIWLDNDMTILGYPGKRLWEVLYGMLQSDTHTSIAKLDRNILINQI